MTLAFLLQAVNMLAFSHYTTPALVVFGSAFTGLCYGTIFTLMPAATADFYGIRNLGVNYGLVFTAFGMAGVVGPMLGAEIQRSLQILCSCLSNLGGDAGAGSPARDPDRAAGEAGRAGRAAARCPARQTSLTLNQQPINQNNESNAIIDSLGPGRITGHRQRPTHHVHRRHPGARARPSPAEQTIQDIKNPVSWLSWGGDLRVRNEYFNNALSLGVPNGAIGFGNVHEQEYLRFRGRLWASLFPTNDLTLNVRLAAEPREFLKPATMDTFYQQEGPQWRYGIFDNLNVAMEKAVRSSRHPDCGTPGHFAWRRFAGGRRHAGGRLVHHLCGRRARDL